MRDVSKVTAPGDGAVLLTARDLQDMRSLHAADFRDGEAVVHSGTGAYLGLAPDGSLCLCRGPCRMVGGVWTAGVDAAATAAAAGQVITADRLTMALIR